MELLGGAWVQYPWKFPRWNLKMASERRGHWRGRPLWMEGQQAGYAEELTSLFVGAARWKNLRPTHQVLSAYREDLPGAIMCPVQVVPTAHSSPKAGPGNQLLPRGQWAEHTFQGQAMAGQPALVQLRGKPAITSSGWPPPTRLKVQLNICNIYGQIFLQNISNKWFSFWFVILEVPFFFFSSSSAP